MFDSPRTLTSRPRQHAPPGARRLELSQYARTRRQLHRTGRGSSVPVNLCPIGADLSRFVCRLHSRPHVVYSIVHASILIGSLVFCSRGCRGELRYSNTSSGLLERPTKRQQNHATRKHAECLPPHNEQYTVQYERWGLRRILHRSDSLR